jgi:pimeloyl-ACP methyl ester carboxylesterase
VARVATADGLELHVEAHGDGSPILFSTGYCQTSENFRGQVEPLVAAGHRVILWDYRGHGRSDAPEEPGFYSMDLVVDDLSRVLRWGAGDRPAVLAGLSFGGLASLHFTLHEPERTRALLLIASGPGFKKPAAQERWEAMTERAALRLEARGFDGYIAGSAGPSAIGIRPELARAAAAGRAIESQAPRAVACFGRRVTGPCPTVIDDLSGIVAPTLVVVGAEDAAFLPASEVMEARMPNAERVVIPDAGHCVNIEQAAAFNREVETFLEGLPVAGS